jgi:Ser/Thr protein kinase RdoA (MazF antagonist)
MDLPREEPLQAVTPEDTDDEPDLEDAGEVTGTLAMRLEQLRDERWLNPVLESALARMTGHAPTVDASRIEYCKIKPNRDINVAVVVRVSGNGTVAVHDRRLSCTLFPTAEACRRKHAEDGPGLHHESTRRALEAAGFARSVVTLDDPAMIVRVFPVDPALPGLAPATDVTEMRAHFAERLEAWRGKAPPRVRCEILHYKPRRSCAIHYLLDAESAADGARPAMRVYGKLSRDDRGVRYHQLLKAAWDASLESGGLWRAARPVEYSAPWRLLLQEAVTGRDFRLVFGDLTPDDITPTQQVRVEALLAAIARAVRSLQRAPLVAGPKLTFAQLFASQERNLRYMRGLQPKLAAELAGIRAEARRLEGRTKGAPPVFAHGDFAHGNVLIDGDSVGIIDFDKAGAAEPAYDVAYFLTHMWSFGIRHPRRMPHVARLSQGFRDAYLALAPEVSSARLALYEALDFSAYVLRNFRKQSHQAQWLAWAEAQVAAAWERLGVAAGGKGT